MTSQWIKNPNWVVNTNSDPDAENTPLSAFDEDPETLWVGSPEENPPHWVILDLGSPHQLSRVRIQTVSDIEHTVRSFSLLYGRTAEGPFITIDSFKCQKAGDPQKFSFKETTCQFIQIYIGSTYGGWQAHVRDIAFYGKPYEGEVPFPDENWLNPSPDWIANFSDAKEGYGPDQLFDDADSGTWWNPRGEPPSWIVLDLQKPTALTRVKLTTIDDNIHTVKTFHVMISKTMEGPYSSVATFISKQTAESQEFILPRVIHTQFVQIFVDSSIGGGSARITDLNFFGKESTQESIVFSEIPESANWAEPDEEWLVFYSSGSPVHGPAENLFLPEEEGNLKKRWNPYPIEEPPHWLILDFKTYQTLNKMKVFYTSDHDHTPADIFLQSSFSPEGPWRTEVTIEVVEPSEEEREEKIKEEVYEFPFPINTRYLKVVIHSTWGGNQSWISRLNFFGTFDWTCVEHDELTHDVFINYRESTDKELALKLGLRLGQLGKDDDNAVTVFFDKLCLDENESPDASLKYGLKHATLIILLISEESLQKIPEAAHKQDQVLLEYEAALEKHRKQEAEIFPLLVDNIDGRPFNFGNLPQFPDAPHCSPISSANIRDTMRELFKLNGRPISKGDGFLDRCPEIMAKLESAVKTKARYLDLFTENQNQNF